MKTSRTTRAFRLLAPIAVVTAIAVGGIAWYVHRERERSKLAQPLIEAVDSENVDAVRKLLRQGADPNTRVTENGNPVLVRRSFTAILRGLLHPGNSSGEGIPNLTVAVSRGNARIVTMLLAAGANPGARGSVRSGSIFVHELYDGTTPLYLAAALGQDDIVTALLRHSADPNSRSRSGRTPLFLAVQFLSDVRSYRSRTDPISPETFALIWILGDLEARKQGVGDTDDAKLSAAFERRYDSVIRSLIAAGADVNARDKKGKTPLDCIRDKKRNADLVALLTRVAARD